MGYATIEDRDAIQNESEWPDRALPDTLYELLNGTATRFPHRAAFTFQLTSGPTDKDETLTWQQLHDKACQAANMFRSLGIGENDVVAFVLPNATETVLTYLGGAIAGIVSPINPLLEPEQIGAILRETGAKAVVTLRAFPKTDVAQKVAKAVSLAPDVKTVIEVDLLRHLTGAKRLIVPLIRPKNPVAHKARVIDFNRELEKHPPRLAFEDAAGDRIAAYFHTGGTTGMPKVVQHRYSGIIYNAWLGQRLLFTEDDVQMCPMPLFHVFATIVAFGASLASGAQIVFPTPQGYRGDGVFDNFWKLIERYKATFVITVPTAMSALMQRKVDADISSLKLVFCGSSPLPVELYNRFEAAAGVTICEGYGLSEATCLVSINPPDGVKKIGSVGIPFPYTDVKITSVESGEECAVDVIGEICVSNPGVAMGATYSEPSKNENLYYPGHLGEHQYLRTGDLGRIDPDGYLWITGRAKDLIIRGGHNIDPAQIEEALAAHEAVAFAAAIGQPDGYSGELPCAYVELVDGASVSEDALREFANERIPEKAARLKYVEIVPEIPKTAVGKPLKNELRKLAIRRVYNEALSHAEVGAEVSEVIEDKKRGLVAQVVPVGTVAKEDVAKALGDFTRPWEWNG